MLLTPDEAIHFLALDRQNLRAPREALRWLCRTKQVQFTKVGRYVRFKKEWLDDLVERNRTGVDVRKPEPPHNQ